MVKKAGRVGVVLPREEKPLGVPYCDLRYLNMAYKKDGENLLYQGL